MHGEPLVYKPTDYQRHLWRYHKLTDEAAKQSEGEGSKRYEAFPDFADEVYHRMYSEHPQKLEEPAPGAEVFERLHGLMDDLPEMKDLRERCCGNERWAGIGTAAVLDTIIAQVESTGEQVKDVRGDEEVEKYLREMLENTEDEDEKRNIEEMLDPNVSDSLPARAQKAADAVNGIDDTTVRNALRAAAKKAEGQIKQEEELVGALGVGHEKHSGRKAHMGVQGKLAKIVMGNKRLQDIAQIAGRLRRIAMEQQRQKPQKGTSEVTGIELGADLPKMVPAEALYMDDSVDMVFAAKLHDRSLAQYELSTVPKKERGPIVILIDSSGSMRNNNNDIWAAAVSLAFLQIASEQKRHAALIHFGSKVIREDYFEYFGDDNLEKILESASFFAADGGTNFDRPLARATEIISNQKKYEDADVIMITDAMASVGNEFLANYAEAKKILGFSCYSILLGSDTSTSVNELFSDQVVSLSQAMKDDKEMHRYFGAV